MSYPPYLDWLVDLVVNNEVELFQHNVSLHDQVGQLRVQLKLLRRDGRLSCLLLLLMLSAIVYM